MNEFETVLRLAAEVLGKDLRRAKLLCAFASHCFDGTEIHHAIDLELRGLENENAAARIKDAIEQKYRNTIPIDVVIELVGRLVDLTWDQAADK